jgi:hypothetical protein
VNENATISIMESNTQTNIIKYKNSVEYNLHKYQTSFPLRKPSLIPILFTERSLQTPARESYQLQEIKVSK